MVPGAFVTGWGFCNWLAFCNWLGLLSYIIYRVLATNRSASYNYGSASYNYGPTIASHFWPSY